MGKKKTLIWVGAGVAAVAIAVGVIVGVNSAVHASKVDQYIATLQVDPGASFPNATRETYEKMLDFNCKRVAEGWTDAQAAASASQSWSSVSGLSDISKEQYIANAVAVLAAARPLC